MNSKDTNTQDKYSTSIKVEDNGPKWGSYVKQNADQSFPYDAQMKSERPGDWMKMINERTSWLNRNSKYDYTSGKIYPRSTSSSKKHLQKDDKSNNLKK